MAVIDSFGASGTRLTAAVPRGRPVLHRDLVAAQAVDLALVREEQQVGVGRGVHDLADQVLLLQPGPLHAPAAAALGPEGGRRHRLDVAGPGHGDDDLLVVDEVLDPHLARVVGDDAAARVGVLVADRGHLGLDDAAQLAVVGQDRLELGDGRAQLGHLLLQLGPAQPGQAAQGHVEDVGRLHLGERERLGHQRGPGRGPVGRGPDGGDDGVEHVDGPQEALDDVGPVARLLQAELRTAPDDLDLVVDVVRQRLGQVQRAGHAVHQGQHVDAEAGLQRRLLEQVVEDDVGVGVALELNDEPRLLVGRGVAQLADAVEVAGPHQLGDLLLNHLDRGLVRELGDDDAVADASLLDLGDGPHLDGAAAGPVGVEDALAPEDQRARREVGALDELHQVVGRGLGMVQHVDGGVDHLAHVVRRDVGRHAHGDALRPVDEQVGEARRQHHRLVRGAVVVGHHVDGLLVDVGHELEGQRRQPALGVAHGRRAVVGPAAAEAAVAVDQRVAERELLDHAGQRLVDGRVAVGVVRPHDLAHDLGALVVRPVRAQPVVEHGVEDPAVHRLEAVAHVGQGAGDDDRHGVLEERALHLLLDLNGLDGAADRLVGAGRGVAAPARARSPAARAACRLAWHVLPYSPSARSDVEETDVFGIGLNEVAAQLHVVTHEDGAHLVRQSRPAPR